MTNQVKLLQKFYLLMTKQKAIKILEKYHQYIIQNSQGWKELGKSLQTPDIRDIATKWGEILDCDSRIIKEALDELKHDSARKAKPLRH